MNRILLALLFVISTAGLAVFLWRKQVSSYDFSMENEKQLFLGIREEAKRFEKNLPPLDVPPHLRDLLEKYKEEENGTTTLDSTTSTSKEALEEFFAALQKLEKAGQSTTTEEQPIH